MKLGFENTYARLPEMFYARVRPTQVSRPRLIAFNEELARELDLPNDADVWAGNTVPEDAEPVALAYAGHQFGHFAGRLGDGRAILLGEKRGRDIQLKGAGRTPFSRGGDGRAPLGPVLREYVVSEAMHALGVPTTRALAAVATGEVVHRERALPGAVITRVARSHVRVGTFELFARDEDALRTLVSYCVKRLYPDAEDTPQTLLERVVQAQAFLVAQWLGLGFIHGVMNTDNTSISGETIDYGPAAFLDVYDPRKAFSSIDTGGRYAYGNQPSIAAWNVTRLAQTLLPLIDESSANEVLETFSGHFEHAFLAVFRKKLGLSREESGDLQLVSDLLNLMGESEVDFTLFFRRLSHDLRAPFRAWNDRWQARLVSEANPQALMLASNPAVIPRNHRIEQMIAHAVERDDFSRLNELLRVLRRPFEDDASASWLAEPPREEERVVATFCGT